MRRRTPCFRLCADAGVEGSKGIRGESTPSVYNSPMQRITAAVVMMAIAAPSVAQTSWTLSSPDGHNTIAVARQADGALVWRVARDGQPILADSPLGIRRADQEFTKALTFV